MTDKSKDERRPARRPGGDAAWSSKGVKKVNRPRGFSDTKGAGDRPRTHAGEAKQRFGGAGRSDNRFERGDRPARRFGDGGAPRAEKPRFDSPRGDDKRFSRPDRPARQFDERSKAPDSAASGPDRIAKVMARAGVASRRDAEVMIAEGRVSINGNVIDTPATLVGSEDRVLIDGAPMPARECTRLWLFHKPRGLVTTARDPEGRPTVFDSLPAELPRVVAVGRLDINTEGLLLLTNDGGLARVLEHPETAWLRRYRVRAYGDINQAELDGLRNGITIDGMHYGPVEAAIQRTQGDNVWLTLGLREGKNREVKRILEHLGLRVNRLIRVSFGPFQLGDLGEGVLEEVRTRILKDQLGETLAREAGVDFEAGVSQTGDEYARSYAQAGKERTSRESGHGGRFRSREDFIARGPRSSVAPAPEYKRETYEQRSQERAIWRDAETEAVRPKGKRVPRRGVDAREARAQSGERAHVRAGAVTDPGGRKVKVERLVSAPKLAERPARKAWGEGFQKRDAFNKQGADDMGARPVRRFGRDDQEGERRTFADRANRTDEGFRRDNRTHGDKQAFEQRSGKPFGERSSREAGSGSGKQSRPFAGKPNKSGFSRDSAPGKSSAGKSNFAGKPSHGKPSYGKPFSGRPSGPRGSGSRKP